MKTMILTAALLASSAYAAEVNLIPKKDNTLFQSSGSLSNGAGEFLFAGKTAAGPLHRALLQFDIANALPQGAVVTDVQLYLNVDRFAGGTHPMYLLAVAREWGEGSSNATGNEGRGATAQPGEATWSNAKFGTGGVAWTTPGGDVAATPDGVTSFGGLFGTMTFSSQEMVDRVQHWLDSPTDNHGWMVKGEEVAFATSVRFDSRENGTPAFRPRLQIFYSCPADFNHSGAVDFTDYLDFVQALSDGAATADFNHDQVIDLFDYLDFVQHFSQDC